VNDYNTLRLPRFLAVRVGWLIALRILRLPHPFFARWESTPKDKGDASIGNCSDWKAIRFEGDLIGRRSILYAIF
jgi:hypothetical protein